MTKASTVTAPLSPRIEAFRNELIKQIPRVPHDRSSERAFRSQPTRKLILAYCTWRNRLIPAKPRKVQVWSGGVSLSAVCALQPKLCHLLEAVDKGYDLTPFLSRGASTKGVVLTGALSQQRRADIDSVLIRDGLHHFHVAERSAENPSGRSDTLVFADVGSEDFTIVAISDHRAFKSGTRESLRFFEICRAYIAREVPTGQAFMSNPVMCSGHSLLMTVFADKCEAEMEYRDPFLDDPAFAKDLYACRPMRDGKAILMPGQPRFGWHFADLEFGILDRRTSVFFSLLPYFPR